MNPVLLLLLLPLLANHKKDEKKEFDFDLGWLLLTMALSPQGIASSLSTPVTTSTPSTTSPTSPPAGFATSLNPALLLVPALLGGDCFGRRSDDKGAEREHSDERLLFLALALSGQLFGTGPLLSPTPPAVSSTPTVVSSTPPVVSSGSAFPVGGFGGYATQQIDPTTLLLLAAIGGGDLFGGQRRWWRRAGNEEKGGDA